MIKYGASLISFLVSAPLVLASQVGNVVIDGVSKPVYFENSGGKPLKYYLNASGNKVDVREKLREDFENKKAKYGVFGAELHGILADSRSNIEVTVSFPKTPIVGDLPGGRLTSSQARFQNEDAFHKGIARLEAEIGKLPNEKRAFKGSNEVRLSLSKAELERLKYNSAIQSIEVVPTEARKVKTQASLQHSFALVSGVSYGGLRYSATGCYNGDCGNGQAVGVSEPFPIWNSDSSGRLNGTWFTKRLGTPLYSRHPHGLWVSGIIRNSVGGANVWDSGGAYNLSGLYLGYPLSSETDMVGTYSWLVDDHSLRVVNSSWDAVRYNNSTQSTYAWGLDRYYDINAATYPYVLNVIAAGNSGELDEGNNQECQDNSTPAWTDTQCQRVGWWGHNHLIVGAAYNNAKAAFSSWRDGLYDNEAPHVIVRGAGVELPWMGTYASPSGYNCPGDTATANTDGEICGTSFAAPTIAAMAANLRSSHSNVLYPETIKNIRLFGRSSG